MQEHAGDQPPVLPLADRRAVVDPELNQRAILETGQVLRGETDADGDQEEGGDGGAAAEQHGGIVSRNRRPPGPSSPRPLSPVPSPLPHRERGGSIKPALAFAFANFSLFSR